MKYEPEIKRYRIYLEINTLQGALYTNVMQLWQPLRTAFMREAGIQFVMAKCQHNAAFAQIIFIDRGHH